MDKVVHCSDVYKSKYLKRQMFISGRLDFSCRDTAGSPGTKQPQPLSWERSMGCREARWSRGIPGSQVAPV